jgi:hypothetical protein
MRTIGMIAPIPSSKSSGNRQQPAAWKGKLAMQGIERQPELNELVREASKALACLDADRLEELALSCQALNRNPAAETAAERAALTRQAKEAVGDMAVFGRVLEATRANLQVMNRLRELRAGRLEYKEHQSRGWTATESGHGDN